MATNVERISSVSTSLNQQTAPGGSTASADAGEQASRDLTAADYRLIIELDRNTGSYVYKTLNRQTGEVVSQFPREEVLRLQENPAYVAGKVIATRA